MVAMSNAVKGTGIPTASLWESILGRKMDLVLFEDNTAMIKVVKNGISPNLRHLNRTHGVSIAATSSLLHDGQFRIEYLESKKMKADIFTKGFNSKQILG